MPLPYRHPEGEALAVDQGAISERAAPDPVQDLHRLDGPDYPARGGPLRGRGDLKNQKGAGDGQEYKTAFS